MTERLLTALREQTAGLPVVGDVRRRGMMIGVEFVDPKRVDDFGRPVPDGALASSVQRRMHDMGELVEIGGPHGAVYPLLPPLIVQAEHVDFIRCRFRTGRAARMSAR
jgi:diaminobutyrate-2-oxoglutarate transaminase